MASSAFPLNSDRIARNVSNGRLFHLSIYYDMLAFQFPPYHRRTWLFTPILAVGFDCSHAFQFFRLCECVVRLDAPHRWPAALPGRRLVAAPPANGAGFLPVHL